MASESKNSIITDELRKKWNECKSSHRVQELAFDGCMEHCGYDLSFAYKKTVDAVLCACLDSMPKGDRIARLSAALKLGEIRREQGW